MTIEQAIDFARTMGLEVTENNYRTIAHGIGPYPATPVGQECRSITASFDGAVRYVIADRGDDADLRPLVREPVDPAVLEVGEQLLAACRAAGVGLWWGSSRAGIGCMLQYTPPLAAQAKRLAEDIRVTRIRVLEWPGRGHEERLAGLMAML